MKPAVPMIQSGPNNKSKYLGSAKWHDYDISVVRFRVMIHRIEA